MVKRQAFFAILTAGTVLAACSGGGSGGVPPASNASRNGTAKFTIDVPKLVNTGSKRSPHFVSPNTQSVSISVNGAAPAIANLTPSSPNCTQTPATGAVLTCSINVTAPIATDTFVVKLFDGVNGSGNVLAFSTVVRQIGASTPITIEMNGLATSLTVFLSNPSPLIGEAAQIQVGVTAMDASGAVIMGPGNFTSPVMLSSDDHSGHTSLSGTTLAGPSSTVTLNYDGSAAITTVTISGSAGGVTKAVPAVMRPANAQNGGGGVAVVHIGADAYAEIPSAAGLIQVKLTDNGALATTPPSPNPAPTGRGTLLSIPKGVDSCAIAPVANKIDAFCVNVNMNQTPIDVIDLTSGTPALAATLPTDATTQLSYSGGLCYVCGITWDPVDSAVLISTGNNANRSTSLSGSFEFYKTDGAQARASIPVNSLTENFAYNSVTNQIFNFGYVQADLVDVASSTVYTSTDAIYTAPNDPGECAGDTAGPCMDSSAVDPSTNVNLAVDEFGTIDFIAPMNSAVLVTPAPAKAQRSLTGFAGGTFTNAFAARSNFTLDTASDGCLPTAVTIDSTSHLAFLSGEYSDPNCVAAVQLPSSSPDAPFMPTTYTSIPAMPNTPDGFVFQSARDPHVSATFYLTGSDVFGLVYNLERSWVAVVDLTKLLAAPTSGLDPHVVDPAYDLVANGVVTYLPSGLSPGPASNARLRKDASRHHR